MLPNNNVDQLQYVLGTLFSVIGGGLLLVCLWLAISNINILRTWEHATGVVVSSERAGPSRGKHSTFWLRVRYESRHGPATATADRSFYSFEVGAPVSVYYQTEAPSRIVINSLRTIWFVPLVTGVVGTIFFVLGLMALLGIMRAKSNGPAGSR